MSQFLARVFDGPFSDAIQDFNSIGPLGFGPSFVMKFVRSRFWARFLQLFPKSLVTVKYQRGKNYYRPIFLFWGIIWASAMSYRTEKIPAQNYLDR